jgi:peptide/nickel transport system substrate-binding protein
MKRLLMLCLFLGLSFGLALPLKGASDKPKRGGTLTMAVRRGPSLMNPMISTKSSEARVREIMFESLLGIDQQGNVQPNLAESWETSANGKVEIS